MTTPWDWLPTDDTPPAEAALLYALHGLKVTPVHGLKPGPICTCHMGVKCDTPGKHPTSNAWQKKASASPDVVRELFRGLAITNVGIVVDDRHALLDVDGDEGRASLAALIAEHGPLPETLSSTSGRGEHRLFALAGHHIARRLRNRRILPGLDVKVKNGQFVVAPSHHKAGVQYRWVTRVEPAILPDWLYESMSKDKHEVRVDVPDNVVPIHRPTLSAPSGGWSRAYVQKAVDEELAILRGNTLGNRNNALNDAAFSLGTLVGAGAVSESEVVSALELAAAAIGLEKRETTTTIRSGLRAGKANPRAVPQPKMQRRQKAANDAIYDGLGYVTDDGEIIEPARTVSVDADASHGPLPAQSGPDVSQAARVRVEALLTDAKGNTRNTFGNLCKILRSTPAYSLAYDEMRLTPRVNGNLLTDPVIGRIREKLFEDQYEISPSANELSQAVMTVADDESYHPVRRYLQSLEWDGAPRIASIATNVLGIEEPDDITQTMIRKWMVSAVARAMNPGCKVDTVLVLIGEQGAQKSSFFRALAGEWFGEGRMDIRNKDGVLQLYAAWIYEWAEIERVTLGYAAEETKLFLSQQTDLIRKPYARGVTMENRHTVVVGTTNRNEYLDDATGDRRYHSILVGAFINLIQLDAWRDDLWAEAVAGYMAGEDWWLAKEEEAVRVLKSSEHQVEDAWDAIIGPYANGCKNPFTTQDVLSTALELKMNEQNRANQMRVAACLKSLGFEKFRMHHDRRRFWRKAVKPTT
jgi:hypothetical protein